MHYKEGNSTHVLTIFSLRWLLKIEDEINYVAIWKNALWEVSMLELWAES